MKNHMRRAVTAVAVSLVLGGVSPQLLADKDTEEKIIKAAVVAAILFGDKERRVFSDYLEELAKYGDHHNSHKKKSLPPGLKKKVANGGSLPPGWQKKVARGEVLDDDLYHSSYRLPGEILRRLPPQPEGTSLRRIDDRIVRVVDATLTILDVFYLH